MKFNLNRKIILLFSCVVLILFLEGCGTGGHLITKPQLYKIKIGETTKVEVETILGKPNSINPTDATSAKAEIWTYHLAKYASDPQTGVPPIGITSWPITRNRPRPTIIDIVFNSSDVVTRIQERLRP